MREDRVEVLHDVVLAPDHQAEAALEAEHAAARADVDVVDALGLQLRRAVHVVAVVAVAAVDDDVAGLEQLGDLVDQPARDRRGHHEPHGTRLVELLHEIGHRVCTLRPEVFDRPSSVRARVGTHAIVTGTGQPADQPCAHPSQTDHSELHGALPFGLPRRIMPRDVERRIGRSGRQWGHGPRRRRRLLHAVHEGRGAATRTLARSSRVAARRIRTRRRRRSEQDPMSWWKAFEKAWADAGSPTRRRDLGRRSAARNGRNRRGRHAGPPGQAVERHRDRRPTPSG